MLKNKIKGPSTRGASIVILFSQPALPNKKAGDEADC